MIGKSWNRMWFEQFNLDYYAPARKWLSWFRNYQRTLGNKINMVYAVQFCLLSSI